MFNLKPSPVSLEVFFTHFVVFLTKLMGFPINQRILKNFERTLTPDLGMKPNRVTLISLSLFFEDPSLFKPP